MEGNLQVISVEPGSGLSLPVSPGTINQQTPIIETIQKIEQPKVPSQIQNSVDNFSHENPQNTANSTAPNNSPNPPNSLDQENQNSVDGSSQENPQNTANSTVPSNSPGSTIPTNPEMLNEDENRPEVIIYDHMESIESLENEQIPTVLVLGQADVGKSSLINKLLDVDTTVDEGGNLIFNSEPDIEAPNIGDSVKGTGTFYPHVYRMEKGEKVLNLVDTAGLNSKKMNKAKKVSSDIILEMMVRRSHEIKIVFVEKYDDITSVNSMISKEIKILKQIIKKPDTDIIIAINNYRTYGNISEVDEATKVEAVNQKILENFKKEKETLENDIKENMKKVLKSKIQYEKIFDLVIGKNNEIIKARKPKVETEPWNQIYYKFQENKNKDIMELEFSLQEIEKVFNLCLDNPEFKDELIRDPQFEDSPQDIEDKIFVYRFLKLIIENENFQYYDLNNNNSASIDQLKDKIIKLGTITKENLVFGTKESPVYHEFHKFMDKYCRETLPELKRYIFCKNYPAASLSALKEHLEAQFVQNYSNKDIESLESKLKLYVKNLEEKIKKQEDKKNELDKNDDLDLIDEYDFNDNVPSILVERKTKFPIVKFVENLEEGTHRLWLNNEQTKKFIAKYTTSRLYCFLNGPTPCKGKIRLYTRKSKSQEAKIENLENQIKLKKRLIYRINHRLRELDDTRNRNNAFENQRMEDLSLLDEMIRNVQEQNPYDDSCKERDEYLLRIFSEISIDLYNNVTVFKDYLKRINPNQPNDPLDIFNKVINDYTKLYDKKLDYMWIPDDCVSSCMRCHVKFSWRYRKHHCRRCGDCLCSKCFQKKAKINDQEPEQGVCEECYNYIVNIKEKKNADQSSEHQ